MVVKNKAYTDRNSLLADIAEMYYIDGKDQSAIAKEIGVTRSMISKLLSLARSQKIVEIIIHHQLNYDHELEQEIASRFGVSSVFVIQNAHQEYQKILKIIGQAAAEVLKKLLLQNSVFGVSWGATPSATVNAIEKIDESNIKIVQLLGAMGAQNTEYDGHALVSRLAEKLAAEPYYINAPYRCPTKEIAWQMKITPGIMETIELGKSVDIALLGIGSIELDYSSYFLSGLLTAETIKSFKESGVVGDVASHFFSLDGTIYKNSYLDNLITIDLDDLTRIPIRIGVSGGSGKIKPIIGALKAELINVLVTDTITAKEILTYCG